MDKQEQVFEGNPLDIQEKELKEKWVFEMFQELAKVENFEKFLHVTKGLDLKRKWPMTKPEQQWYVHGHFAFADYLHKQVKAAKAIIEK